MLVVGCDTINVYPLSQNLYFCSARHLLWPCSSLCITTGSSMVRSNFLIPAMRHIKLALKPAQAFTKVKCHLPELIDFQQSIEKFLVCPVQTGSLIWWLSWKSPSPVYSRGSNRKISFTYSGLLWVSQTVLPVLVILAGILQCLTLPQSCCLE